MVIETNSIKVEDMTTITKNDAHAIIEASTAKWFLIMGIENTGNTYSWIGTGFNLMDDQDGFMPMNAIAREKALAEFNKAFISASNNQNKGILFKNGGEIKIIPLATF